MVGKRYSRQRELIHQSLMQSHEHPTAEMVYQALKPSNPNLSLGTVYRNLNLLSEEGAIRRMPFPVERYDADLAPHPHLQCRACGSVYDLQLPEYDANLDQRVSEATGHDVERHDLVFFGTCYRCTKKH